MDIIVISGFLGAGKTTFVLQLARQLVEARGRKVAIIENEAGKVGIDDARLRDAGLKVREVFGGCVCCSMGANLMMTLSQLQRDVQPDVVIVEPSGVASPGGIRQLLTSTNLSIERVKLAVLFDAERFKAFHRVAGPFIEDSLRVADVAVVNKADLAEPAAVTDLVDRLVQMAGGKPVLAMSAKTGRGVDRLMTELIGEQPVMFTRIAEPGAALEDSLCPGMAGRHNHAGEPGVYACQRRMSFDRPQAAAAVAAELAVMMQRLAGAVDAADGAVIGHIKAQVHTDAGDTFISTTSSARPPEVTGTTTGVTRSADVTLNVLAYRLSEAQLQALTAENWPQ